MSYRRPAGRVENFTNPFLVMFGVNVLIWLGVVLAVYGVSWVLLTAAGFDLIVKRFIHRSG